MADLERRGSYTPRRVREQRAYRMAVGGAVSGGVGVVTLIMAIAGLGTGVIALIAFIVAGLCAMGFVRTVNSR
jgi:hypothetical protein